MVKKGDLLIRINPDTYKAQVAQQEAAISAAKASSLMNYAQLMKAKEDLKRYTDLYSRKVINDSDMTNYKTLEQVAEATYNASQAQVDQANSLAQPGQGPAGKNVHLFAHRWHHQPA